MNALYDVFLHVIKDVRVLHHLSGWLELREMHHDVVDVQISVHDVTYVQVIETHRYLSDQCSELSF